MTGRANLENTGELFVEVERGDVVVVDVVVVAVVVVDVDVVVVVVVVVVVISWTGSAKAP